MWALTVQSEKRLKGKNQFRRRVRGRASPALRFGCLLFAMATVFLATFVLTHYVEEGAAGFAGSLRRRMMGAQATCENALDMVGAPDAKGALAIPIYIIVIMWFFLGLAIVTDDFFVPSLVVISEKLKLTPDVAGATFMAAGSSAPELFTNLADISTYGNSTGIGTIVGSAVFNILVIIACSAAFAKSALNVDWRPMARDVSFYLMSIFMLFVFVQGWGSTKAPLHSMQYSLDSRASAGAVGFDGASRPENYPGTEPREWYAQGGSRFPDGQNLALDGAMDITAGHVCCDEVSEDGTYCVSLSGNNSRVLIDTETPYLHDSHDTHDIFHAGEAECHAIRDRDGFNSADFPLISATLTYNGESALYCCDPESVLATYDYVRNAGRTTTKYEGGRPEVIGSLGYMVPTLDPLQDMPTCAVPVTRWECACDSGSNTFPTAYTHGKPVCEGNLQAEGRITWWEALIMVLSYGFYIAFMFFNETLLGMCPKCGRAAMDDKERVLERARNATAAPAEQELQPAEGNEDGDDEAPRRKKSKSESDRLPDADGDAEEPAVEDGDKDADEKSEDGGSDSDEEKTGIMACLDKFYCLFAWPWTILFQLTIPDCNFEEEEEKMIEGKKPQEEIDAAKAKKTKWYMVSFFMSIVWIGGMSVVMVLFANWLGCLVGISSIIMGVTVLAAGTSVPDALGSIISARQGEGDMAVANAIGSNVFDILLALGFPYFLSALIKQTPYCVDTSGILVHIVILFTTVIAVIAIFSLVGWKLNKMLGGIMLFLYAGFLIYSVVDGVQQQVQIDICQQITEAGGGRRLGHSSFMRNGADLGLYKIYASSNGNFNYDFWSPGSDGCPDICGNRYAKADL